MGMAEAVPVPLPTERDLSRFWERVRKDDGDGCWEWSGARFTSGYGMFYLGGKARRAHRVSYVWELGDPGEGLDHLCRNRLCVRPSHLQPVSNRVNVLRGVGVTAKNAKASHCVNGHEFTPENTYVDPRGWRQCRTCLRDASRRHRLRRR